MQKIAPMIDVLPSFSAVPCVLLPEDFQNVSYSFRLLLPVSLPSVIVDDVEYAEGCEIGFDVYFDYPEIYESHSLSALKEFIMQELFPGPSDSASLAVRVGCVHGFLSVLAFTDRALAFVGLDILTRLTDHLAFLSFGSWDERCGEMASR